MLLFIITIPASIAAIAAAVAVVLPIFTFFYYSVTFGGWAWKFFNWIRRKFAVISDEEKEFAKFYREERGEQKDIAQKFYDEANNTIRAQYPQFLGTAKGDLLIIKSRILKFFDGNKKGKKLYLAIKNLYLSIEDENERKRKEQEAYKKIAGWFVEAKDGDDVVYYLRYVITLGIDINDLSFSPEKFHKAVEIYNKAKNEKDKDDHNKIFYIGRFFKLILVLGTDFVNNLPDGKLAKFISSGGLFHEFDDAFRRQHELNKEKFGSGNEKQLKDATSNVMKFWTLCNLEYAGYEADKRFAEAVELCSMLGDDCLVSIENKVVEYVVGKEGDSFKSEYPFARKILDSESERLSLLKGDKLEVSKKKDNDGEYNFESIDENKFIEDLGSDNIKFAKTQSDIDRTLKYHVMKVIGESKANKATKKIYLAMKKLPEEQKRHVCICLSKFPEATKIICENYDKLGGQKRSFENFDPKRVENFNKFIAANENNVFDDVNVCLRLWKCIDLFGFEFVDKFRDDVISVVKDKKLWGKFYQIKKKTVCIHAKICPSACRHELRFWLMFLTSGKKNFNDAKKIFTEVFSSSRPYLFNKVKYDDLKSMVEDLGSWKNIKEEIFAKKEEVPSVSKRTVRERSASCSDLQVVPQLKIEKTEGELNIG